MRLPPRERASLDSMAQPSAGLPMANPGQKSEPNPETHEFSLFTGMRVKIPFGRGSGQPIRGNGTEQGPIST